MILANASAALNIAATISPPADSPATGANSLAKRLTVDLSACQTAFRETFLFSAPDQTITYNRTTGVVTGLTGVKQVETATVVAPAGCTAGGNLQVLFNSSLVTPVEPETHPQEVLVLLTLADTTATLIAAKIAAALNADNFFTTYYIATSSGADVIATNRNRLANDTAFNIRISEGLGVTAALTSANTTPGVLGPWVQRAGGAAGADFYGRPLATAAAARMMLVTNVASATGATITVTNNAGGAGIMPVLSPGQTNVYLANPATTSALPAVIDFTASGALELEIYTLSETP